jgi:hypothetical protein
MARVTSPVADRGEPESPKVSSAFDRALDVDGCPPSRENRAEGPKKTVEPKRADPHRGRVVER